MASTNIDDQGPPNAFFAFFEWCQQHRRQRGWDRLDEAAARYLRNLSFIQRDHTSNTGDEIMRLLDAVPQARITKARLSEAAAQGDDTGEQKWILPSGVDLRGLPTYQMRTIPDDQRGNWRVVFLDIMEAHMEPVAKLPSREIKKYRQCERSKVERAYIEVEVKEDEAEQRNTVAVY
ncbi:hypothetical protein PC123_g26778 [Phytophthora cactorum]|nr:hypothetical protein PC123_g26778 [Phytophthora cactorum]